MTTRRAAGSGSSRDVGGDRVEGRRPVRELLLAQRRRTKRVWISTGVERNAVIAEILALAETHGVEVRHVRPAELDQLARTDAPQGVIADADALPDVAFDTLLEDPSAFLVALDGVTDPQNLGAILRTAEVAGATGAVIGRHRSASIVPTVTKAAAGAVEYLPIASVGGIPAALDRARRAGIWTVGLDGGGDTDLFDLEVASSPIMLVLGAEGRGLARLTRVRCDVVVSIPMFGRIESLNVAAAAALGCFEVARRRGTVKGSPG